MSSFDLAAEKSEASVSVVRLSGDLDAYNSPRLRQLLVDMIAEGMDKIVLDCRELNYIDSSGLGALVTALKQLPPETGAIMLAGPNVMVTRVLQITGLHKKFPSYGTVAEAQAACESKT